MTEKSLHKLILFCFFSLLFHLFVFASFYYFPALPQHSSERLQQVPPQQKIEFVSLRLADIPQPKKEKTPKKARFISQYNSSVSKETTAQSKNKSQKKSSQKNKKSTNRSLNTNLKPQTKTRQNKGSLFQANLKGFDFSNSQKDGANFHHDFLPSIQGGPVTSINSFADPRGPYFSRLKRKFRLRFNPAPPLRKFFAHNKITSKKISVKLRVTVDGHGDLRHIKVLRSSGIQAYDLECIDTVRDSSPFSSPPKKYLKAGHLHMNWTFVVYIR